MLLHLEIGLKRFFVLGPYSTAAAQTTQLDKSSVLRPFLHCGGTLSIDTAQIRERFTTNDGTNCQLSLYCSSLLKKRMRVTSFLKSSTYLEGWERQWTINKYTSKANGDSWALIKQQQLVFVYDDSKLRANTWATYLWVRESPRRHS